MAGSFKAMRCWKQIALILALALAGTAFSAWCFDRPTFPEADPWARDMAALADLPEVLWVDARPPAVFAQGHIPGATNVSLEDWEPGFVALLDAWEPGQVIVVYCDGEGCALSREVAERLRTELGTTEVYWLSGGLPAWQIAEEASQ